MEVVIQNYFFSLVLAFLTFIRRLSENALLSKLIVISKETMLSISNIWLCLLFGKCLDFDQSTYSRTSPWGRITKNHILKYQRLFIKALFFACAHCLVVVDERKSSHLIPAIYMDTLTGMWCASLRESKNS
jgi:hypothetical protein